MCLTGQSSRSAATIGKFVQAPLGIYYAIRDKLLLRRGRCHHWASVSFAHTAIWHGQTRIEMETPCVRAAPVGRSAIVCAAVERAVYAAIEDASVGRGVWSDMRILVDVAVG